MDVLQGLFDIPKEGPVSSWTDAEIYKFYLSFGGQPPPNFRPDLKGADFTGIALKTGDIMAVSHEVRKRIKRVTTIGPDATMRQSRVITVTPNAVTLTNADGTEEFKPMVLGTVVAKPEDGILLAMSSAILTTGYAKTVNKTPMIVTPPGPIYPEEPILKVSDNKVLETVRKAVLGSVGNTASQQLRLAEAIIDEAERTKNVPLNLANAMLQRWVPRTPMSRIMDQEPDAVMKRMGFKTVYRPAAPPKKQKAQYLGKDLARTIKAHHEVRGMDKSGLSNILVGCYVGDVGMSTKVVTDVMGLRMVLDLYAGAKFVDKMAYFDLSSDFSASIRSQLSKVFAIYSKLGAEVDEITKPGLYQNPGAISIVKHAPTVPTVTAKGEYAVKVDPILVELQALLKQRCIVETYGYQEVFEAFKGHVLINPVGHRGTVYLIPDKVTDIPYDEFAAHTTYCLNWRTFFPYHRRPMWEHYTYSYTILPVVLNCARKEDVKIFEWDIDIAGEGGVDDVDYSPYEAIQVLGNTAPAPVVTVDLLDFLVAEPDDVDDKGKAVGGEPPDHKADLMLSFSNLALEGSQAPAPPVKREKKVNNNNAGNNKNGGGGGNARQFAVKQQGNTPPPKQESKKKKQESRGPQASAASDHPKK